MITPDDLQHRPADLTPRQTHAVALIERYVQANGEPPSYGWLARRCGISRQSAYELMERARQRRFRRY